LRYSLHGKARAIYGLMQTDGSEDLLADLGTHTTGKGCLYVKKLSDVDLAVLEQLARRAV
jgi:hypothetical protein